jgi:hypothetical protein
VPSMWGHRFQSPLLQTVSARGDKPTPGFPISTSENLDLLSRPLRDFIVDALAPCRPRRRARISIGITASIIIARVIQVQQPVQEQWLFGGFQSG